MDEMKDTQRELTDGQIHRLWEELPGIEIYNAAAAQGMSFNELLRRKLARAAIAADRALNAPADLAATDGGRNMFFEGRFDGETEREQSARLRWANDMRGAFEKHTGNAWFDKDWHSETALWSAAWRACKSSSAPADRDAMREALQEIAYAGLSPAMEGGIDDSTLKSHYQNSAFRLVSIAARALAATPTPPAEQQGDLVSVTREDGNNYCVILRELGMEEEGDPVAEVKRLKALAEQQGEQEPVMGGRESVEDALAIVESFGPGTDGLNDTFARQIILADEVKRLRGLYAAAVKGRQDFRDAYRESKSVPSALAELRAKVEGLPNAENFAGYTTLVYLDEVLAEIDKMMGGQK